MKSNLELPDGFEIRGFEIRLYPTQEQERQIASIQAQCRFIWNHLVASTEIVRAHREQWAERNGLVKPHEPWLAWAKRNGIENPDSASREEWRAACRERMGAVIAATKKQPHLQYMGMREMCLRFGFRHDYQLFRHMLSWVEWPSDAAIVHAHVLQALGHSWFSKGVKRYRRHDSEMPFRSRSGDCFELGDFGTRRGKAFYNCQLKINGFRILGRLPGKSPSGRVLEGVSLSKKPDGWYALIRQVVPKRALPDATPGLCVGLDAGLTTLAALSDGRLIDNKRNREFSERIAGRQQLDLPVGRLQQRASRHTRQVCYELARDLSRHDIVAIERLPAWIGQGGSPQVSTMRTLAGILKQRLGDRLREVEPAYTSQDCSQCGTRSKETWSYDNGRYGHCPACGYREHRDVNAARNILRKYLDSLVAGAA